MTKVLQVLTSNDQLGDTGRTTGYWTSELTHAYRQFEQAGYQIDLASIKGGTPPVDPLSDPESPVSSNRNDQISIDFYRDPDVLAQLAHTSRLKDLDPADYDVIYFVGGAGAMWDFPDDPDLIAFVRLMWERGKLVSAVCYGSSALTNVRLSDGFYLGFADETLTMAAVAYTIIAEPEERVTLEGSAPFVVTHRQKRFVFALRAPLDPKAIGDVARLVVTGLILGFVLKGEIALGGEVGVVNNLGGEAVIHGPLMKANQIRC